MVDVGAAGLAEVGVFGAEGVVRGALFELAFLFATAFARGLVFLLATVSDGDVDGIAGEDDNTVGVYPEHQDQQSTDGAV